MVSSLNSPKGKGRAADAKNFVNIVEEREAIGPPLPVCRLYSVSGDSFIFYCRKIIPKRSD